MSIEVTVTQKNIKQFPIHRHDRWEYMLYTQGNGVLKTDKEDIVFSQSTFIAVPPGRQHGSLSENYFVNVCIHSDIAILPISDFAVIHNVSDEIASLFSLISKAYFGDKRSPAAEHLLSALACMLPPESCESEIQKAVREVHEYIAEHFRCAECDIAAEIERRGFSDDYFRIEFGKKYATTPYRHLIALRMSYARLLLRTYGQSLKTYEIARLCGYKDGLYFSKQFKKYYGESPENFK